MPKDFIRALILHIKSKDCIQSLKISYMTLEISYNFIRLHTTSYDFIELHRTSYKSTQTSYKLHLWFLHTNLLEELNSTLRTNSVDVKTSY